MNMIDYNKAIEALEKERQYLLNREQYGAENVLVKHAINVIHELPVIRQPEVVRCKDCKKRNQHHECEYGYHSDVWFCAEGERRS